MKCSRKKETHFISFFWGLGKGIVLKMFSEYLNAVHFKSDYFPPYQIITLISTKAAYCFKSKTSYYTLITFSKIFSIGKSKIKKKIRKTVKTKLKRKRSDNQDPGGNFLIFVQTEREDICKYTQVLGETDKKNETK